MKRILIVLPLAAMLANCSSSHKSTTSTNAGANAPTGSTVGASMNTDMSSSGSTGSATANATGTTTTAGVTGSATTGTGSDAATANTSASTGTSANSATGVTGSASTSASASGSTTTTGSTSAAWSNSMSAQSGSRVPAPGSGYDPNNYMQSPDKYLAPYLLTKTGGWTYSNDWRRNTNFPAEAEGNWQLVLTPETASNWIRDTSHPETYASYWTPEAVAGRQQALMAAAMRWSDSIKAVDSMATMAKASKSGKRSNKYSKKNSAGMTASARARKGKMGVTGSGTTGEMATGGMSTSATATTETGTTGAIGTTGAANANGSLNNTASNSILDSTGAVISSYLTAVNGNNFMMPAVNLYIGNGSFTAYTGCNGALGTLIVDGNKLHFEQPSPSTNIQCVGGFDQSAFIDRLSRADNFDIVNNQIRLKQGEQVLMAFAKSAKL